MEHQPDQSDYTLLAEVLPHGESLSFAGEEKILGPGKQAYAFYYVQEGSVEVSYQGGETTRITVALIGKDQFFGEIGFFDGEKRVREVFAPVACQLVAFDKTHMDGILEKDPDLYSRFITFLIERICARFRNIVAGNEPLATYAASLSTKHDYFSQSKPLPQELVESAIWQKISARVEAIKVGFFDISHRMQQSEKLQQEDPEVKEQCRALISELNRSLPELKKTGEELEEADLMWGYLFKEIYPYFMRSHFAQRAYYKPKGYAGDFLMMEHIYRNIPAGDGTLGQVIDEYCLQRPGSLAIRGRRKLLAAQIAAHSKEAGREGREFHVMNLACGPNRELFDFLADCPYSELINALCVDIDTEALHYTNQHVNTFPHRASIRLMSENVVKWAIGRSKQRIEPRDLIYSAGLCDYLDPRLFRALVSRCYEHLKPGGTLLLGNFAPYADSLFLDQLLKWELLYRTEEELLELMDGSPFGDNVHIIAEEENVNLFIKASKE